VGNVYGFSLGNVFQVTKTFPFGELFGINHVNNEKYIGTCVNNIRTNLLQNIYKKLLVIILFFGFTSFLFPGKIARINYIYEALLIVVYVDTDFSLY